VKRPSHLGRRLGLVLGALALVVGVSAGAISAKTGGASSSHAQKATSITIAHWSSSPVELASLRATLAAFGRAYPSISVKEINLDPYPEGMLARFAARKPPDVFYVDSNVFLDWVTQGVLEPIDSYLKKAHISLKPYYPRLRAAFQYKGKLYGLPKDWSPLAEQVNTSQLAKANVSPPTTWAQLTAAGNALKAAGQPPICLGIDLARILAFMYQNGGGFLNATRTKAIVDTPANNAAVTQYLGWLKSGVAQTPTQLGVGWCGEALGKEKASIIFEGNWVTSFMQDTYPKVKWKSVPMVKNKNRGNLGFTVSYSIAKDSKHKAQAFTLLKYLESKTGQRIWSQASGYLPSRSDVKPPAGRAVFLKEAPATHPWQFAPKFSKVVDTANSELTSAYEGKETVAQALANIQAAAQAAIR
jgi:multiple sugar transport system substrate-binding protein